MAGPLTGLRIIEMAGLRPAQRMVLEKLFCTRTRDEWADLFGTTDACATPVLSMAEALLHPQNVARDTFIEVDGFAQPAPAPRYSGTPTGFPLAPPQAGAHNNMLANLTPII